MSEPGLWEDEGLTGSEAVLECALALRPEGLLGKAHPGSFPSWEEGSCGAAGTQLRAVVCSLPA